MRKAASSARKGERTRVLLVEDHPMLRQGLAGFINAEPDMLVCGEADGANAALKVAAAQKPDIAIVDLSLPDGHGLEVIKNLKALYPRLKVLVLSMHEEAVYAMRALRAGALGYIMKKEQPALVMKAIRAVAQGKASFSSAITSHMIGRLASPKAEAVCSPDELLTDRELEVFECIGNGATTQAIARHLHISLKTVLAHRENIKHKLGFATAAELAHSAFCWVQSH